MNKVFTQEQIDAAHAVIEVAGSYRKGLIQDMLNAALVTSVGGALEAERAAFEAWAKSHKIDLHKISPCDKSAPSYGMGAGERAAWLAGIDYARAQQAGAGQAGFRLVPESITPDMEDAFSSWMNDFVGLDITIKDAGKMYKAMLAAAPSPAPTISPFKIAGLGSITDDDDGVMTLRFVDEAAAKQFMCDYSPTVESDDMPAPASVADKVDAERIGCANPEAVFGDFCERNGYPSDGEWDSALRAAFNEGMDFCKSTLPPISLTSY